MLVQRRHHAGRLDLRKYVGSTSGAGSTSSSGAPSDAGGSSSGSTTSSGGNTDGDDGNWCATLKACCDRIKDEATKKQCTDSWTDTGAPTNPKGADQGCKVLYGAAYAGQCK